MFLMGRFTKIPVLTAVICVKLVDKVPQFIFTKEVKLPLLFFNEEEMISVDFTAEISR